MGPWMTSGQVLWMVTACWNMPPAFRRESNKILHFLPALVLILIAIVVAVALHVI